MPLPDYDTIHAEVSSLAQEARSNAAEPTPVELPKGETATRVHPGVAAPIYLGRTDDLVPDSYVLHYSTSSCTNCGTTSRRSQFYALNYLRSRTGASRVKNLTPCARPLYNLPITRLFTGAVITPYCSECPEIDLSHLPPPPSPAQLYDLPDARLKGQVDRPKTTKEAAAPKPPKKASLDDLV